MKFVCEYEKPMNNWIIHPGIYDVEINGENYLISVAHGVFRFKTSKEELLKCGHFLSSDENPENK